MRNQKKKDKYIGVIKPWELQKGAFDKKLDKKLY